jgi:hypothetical protein
MPRASCKGAAVTGAGLAGIMAGSVAVKTEKRVACGFGNIRRSPSLNGFGKFRDAPPEQQMGFLLGIRHTGPGAKANAEPDAA